LTQEALVTVVYAFVTSRIDYCNSLLYGISDYNHNQFQRIQNSAALRVTNIRKYYHITPVLPKLHWPPVRQRIHFKMLLITCEHLCELVFIRKSSRKLGSSSQILLEVPVYRSNNMVIVRLVLQAPLCGISCRQILEMRRLLKLLNLF